ncbi:nucleoside 2-deoxyribosyltransferase [Pseudomonas typographi]|uniref:Nucleoside 2-deoxyribosyltransferase n=1 Tax=Pseudomonas typographi TaxID=2715964 RepID=A0ABR7Z577_9PSED|nr:nucleoside 2-deoxyribosyltransferase [Pseudomonas typographi]MBD1554165.1 nucleoside 2-deoxyribosyltransferase [Pseudomonas typographi]MBD1589473.1 nucleoside 2-deoxyribosyltransferase [Pseudomonas typographi]MBD1600671.1 nucleoside 2-deoxyribosyltransferase [Pseudomonas typographi]
MARIYLAGFDVFRRDALAHGRYLRQLCQACGLDAQYPLDNRLPPGLAGQGAAHWVCEQNLAMLKASDAVLANLGPFRGQEPDSGTVFETGVAVALGKPVWAYFEPAGTLREQVAHDAQGFDRQGNYVEDFNLPRNLMLACTWAGYSDSAEEAVVHLAAWLKAMGCRR